MENTFEIIKMTAGDKDAVADMMQTFFSTDAVLTNGSPEIFESDINECVSDSPFAEGYVFKKGGEYVGYSMLAKSFSTEFGKRCIWIEDIYFKPQYRGKGLGKLFFEFLFGLYPNVIFRLEAEDQNYIAVKLYKKCGFEVLPYVEMINYGQK